MTKDPFRKGKNVYVQPSLLNSRSKIRLVPGFPASSLQIGSPTQQSSLDEARGPSIPGQLSTEPLFGL